jgi:hypothetical protein
MTNAADKNMTCLERNLRFIVRHLQTVEGNFDTVDELSMAAHSTLRLLEEIRLNAQSVSDSEEEFTVPALREQVAAPIVVRKVEMVRGFGI